MTTAVIQNSEPRPDASARIEHVRAVSLFEDIRENPEALAAVAEVMHEKVYRPRASIIAEGENGSEMYLLVSGQASVFKLTAEGEPYRVAILDGTKHAFFGEGGLLDSDARSATIKADSECHCLVLDRHAFETFGAAHPEWAMPILRRIARVVMARLRKSNNDLMLLYNALVTEIRGQ